MLIYKSPETRLHVFRAFLKDFEYPAAAEPAQKLNRMTRNDFKKINEALKKKCKFLIEETK